MTPRPEAAPAVALVLLGESLVCPHGHVAAQYIRTLAGGAASVYRCQQRRSLGDPVCGQSFLVFPSVMMVAEVTTSLLSEWERRRLSPGQLRDMLGLRWRAPREDVGWDSEEIVAHRAMIAPRDA